MSFGSFFAALSGLQANSSRLSVIGNNLANLNTIGFKTSRATFHDFFAGSSFNGAGNPAQVGLGTSLASIDAVFNQGSLQTTGLLTDVAIQGRGFFVLEDENDGIAYSRAGNFSFDQDGNIVTSGGHFVQGFTTRDPAGNIITSGAPTNLQIPSGLTAPPRMTDEFNMSINLDSRQPAPFSTTMTVYDSLGGQHDMTVSFAPNASQTWDYEVTFGDGEVAGAPAGRFSAATGTITFDGVGNIISPTADIAFTVPGWSNGAISQDFDWKLFNDAGDGMVTGYESISTIGSSNQDGYAVGEIRSLVIDQDGLISGIFSNGAVIDLASLALATFNNENGLLRNGENTFVGTNASGSATIGLPNTGGRGATVSGSLELSNVDITQEFTDLIISQRGYQANSRIITTSDEVIQESLNLKR